MKSILMGHLKAILSRAVAAGEIAPEAAQRLNIETPKLSAHGDFSTPLALLIAAMEKRPPRVVAQRLIDLIRADDEAAGLIAKIEIAGPGYINFFLTPDAGYRALRLAIREGDRYGRTSGGAGQRVQIEFVSANPTGPVHVAHGRAAALGDALANLLAATGCEVEREYYINDIGNQIERLGQSVYLRYRELFGETITLPEEGYRGDYVIEIARAVRETDGEKWMDGSGQDCPPFFAPFALQTTLAWIRRDMERFGVRFDHWVSEASLQGEVEAVLATLKMEGHIYEKDGAQWLATTACGDDKDRVVVRADGRKTYFASDIAYHHNKFARGFDRLINLLGADHHGYVERVKAAAALMGYPPERLSILLYQLVNLMRHGTSVPMSKRSGDFVTLEEVINEVGVDATRFFFLMRRADTSLDFDLELAKKHSNENPVYYVQYAHARLCSILRVADESGEESGIDTAANAPSPPRGAGWDAGGKSPDLTPLSLPEEREIIKQVALYPDRVVEAAEAMEPHRIVVYLQELAGLLHRYYFTHRIITDDRPLTDARLTLVFAARVVLKNALTLLGVRAPDRM